MNKYSKISTRFNILAIALITASFLMLADTLGYFSGIHKIWPIFPALLGTGFILIFMNKGKVEIPMMGIGVFLVLISTFFFYLNYTAWINLKTLWPLFIGFIGIAFGVSSLYTRLNVFKYISLGLVSLSISFLLIFSISYNFWPISITLLGISLLLVGIYEKKYVKK